MTITRLQTSHKYQSASDANHTNHTTQLNIAENLITYTTGISYF